MSLFIAVTYITSIRLRDARIKPNVKYISKKRKKKHASCDKAILIRIGVNGIFDWQKRGYLAKNRTGLGLFGGGSRRILSGGSIVSHRLKWMKLQIVSPSINRPLPCIITVRTLHVSLSNHINWYNYVHVLYTNEIKRKWMILSALFRKL